MNNQFNMEKTKKGDEINKINETVYNIQNQLKEDIHKNNVELKEMNNNINIQLKNKINKENNYILLKLLINKEDIGRNICFLKQFKSFRFNSNFEPDDILIIIDNENIPIKFKYGFETNDKKEPEYYDNAQKIYHELNKDYTFYWNFTSEGIHNIKIIFNKKLMTCEEMFYDFNKIIEVDFYNFNCSKVTSCKNMFFNCTSLRKVDFGLLDFSFCTTYESMFYNCSKLEEVDVTKFNTKNSLSFKNMFYGCSSLKIVDVSKFDSSKCQNIIGMFFNCQNITEINMINWNMENIKNQKNDYFFFINNSLGLPLHGLNPFSPLGIVGLLGV